ncbi:MAG: hypothetical protein ACM3SW_20755, partial [Actinomycetota bacterium]
GAVLPLSLDVRYWNMAQESLLCYQPEEAGSASCLLIILANRSLETHPAKFEQQVGKEAVNWSTVFHTQG